MLCRWRYLIPEFPETYACVTGCTTMVRHIRSFSGPSKLFWYTCRLDIYILYTLYIHCIYICVRTPTLHECLLALAALRAAALARSLIWWESKALNARAARWYFCIPLRMQSQSVYYCYPWRHSVLELRWNILEAPSYELHICAILPHTVFVAIDRKYGIKITMTSTCCKIVISRQISTRIKRHV